MVDIFTYTATDGIASDSATVSIIVNGVNDAPVASDGTLIAAENTAASGTLPATDTENDPLIYRIMANGSQGIGTITNARSGAFTYMPHAGAAGTAA